MMKINLAFREKLGVGGSVGWIGSKEPQLGAHLVLNIELLLTHNCGNP
jgi:hypothetical protein